jgi:hypothetical protein
VEGHATQTGALEEMGVSFCNVTFCEDENDHENGGDSGPAESTDSSKPKLVSLRMEACDEDPISCSILERTLSRNFEMKSALKSFDISFMNLSIEFVQFLEEILQKSVGSLESLKLFGVRVEEDDVMRRLLHSIKFCHNLRTLQIMDCGIEDKHCLSLSRTVRSLTKLCNLILLGNEIDGPALEIFLQHGIARHPELTHLELSGNPIGDYGAIELSDFLSSDSCRKISSVHVELCEIWEDGYVYLMKGLARCGTLQCLSVDTDFEQHFESVVEALKVNMTLTDFVCGIQFSGGNTAKIEPSSSLAQIHYYLRLNKAGRKVLMNEPFASQAWPETFAAASNDVDVLFYILKQRPELMDIEYR